MNENFVKICVVCNTEKSIDNFYNKDRECKQCNIKTSLKRYYESKDKTSHQQKMYYQKNIDKYCYRNKTTDVFSLETLLYTMLIWKTD